MKKIVLCLLICGLVAGLTGCLQGCVAVGHMTNNFPPGRNEAGGFWRSTTDVGVYSDTGEGGQEQSSLSIGGSVAKPGEIPPELPPATPLPADKEPPSSPGATTRTP